MTLRQHVELLKSQARNARHDIDALRQLKKQALDDPAAFIDALRNGSAKFPRLQTLLRTPTVDISKYRKRAGRRAATAYDQNLEFFLRRIQALQEQPPHRKSPFTIATVNTDVANIRAQFGDLLGADYQAIMGRGSALPDTETASELGSRVASPAPIIPPLSYKTSQRVPVTSSALSSSVVPSVANPEQLPANYRTPWTAGEKRRLEQLLARFPEEPVAARRHAKVAAALGTRTAQQVASRLGKMASKAVRREQQSPELVRVDEMLAKKDKILATLTEGAKKSDAFAELMAVSQQLEQARQIILSGQSTSIHWGRSCLLCHSDPIIGSRWQCLDCADSKNAFDFCKHCHGKHHASNKGHRIVRFDVPPHESKERSIGLWAQRSEQVIEDEFAYLDPSRTPDDRHFVFSSSDSE